MKTDEILEEQNVYELIDIINGFKEKQTVLEEITQLFNILFWSLENYQDYDNKHLKRLIELLNGLNANQDTAFANKKAKFLKDYFNVKLILK